jgi:hypothetical protein
MSDTPNLDKLRSATANLQALLQFPEPGLASWHMLIGQSLKAIAEFVPQEERCTVPAGWKLVPLEPTKDMIKAAGWKILPSYEGQVNNQHAYDIVSEKDCTVIYKAMVEASPTPRGGQ